MTEEIKSQPTTGEQDGQVSSSPQGHTGSARYGAERNDSEPTLFGAALVALLASKKIPPLDAVQMLALLHHLFKAADRPLRFQVAEVVYRKSKEARNES